MNYLAVGLNCEIRPHPICCRKYELLSILRESTFLGMQGLAVVGRSLELQTPLFRQRCSLDFTWPQRWLYFSCFGSRDPGGVQIGGWTSFFYIPDPEALLAEVLMDAWIRGFYGSTIGWQIGRAGMFKRFLFLRCN
jgi:hypothetical protein